MQKWEYKIIRQERGWEKSTQKNAPWFEASEWNLSILPELSKLGEEGWELVTVIARSGVLGGFDGGMYSHDYAGFTSEQAWVFKRPKA